ncbi:hypothetical protein Avbf_03609 [Armadillidium vulgare]|nr:hypothetical protein Avbf_03609 [Armadillidium vulgare]
MSCDYTQEGTRIKIPIEKLDFKAKAASKVGSLDNVKHKPKGGEKKIFDDKEYLKQMSSSNASPCKTPTSKTSSGRESGAISPATTGTNSPGPQVLVTQNY